MDWMRAVDAYCERTGPEYWAEPVNALTNAAFLIAALIMWRRTAGLPLARVLCLILFVIGVGSYLFHTHAQVWAGVADSMPIALYILTYVYAINLHVWRWRWWVAALGALAFIPYAVIVGQGFAALPFFTVSAGYWPVPLLIAIYAMLLRDRVPQVAAGLALGAAILVLSLTFRSVDAALCPAIPLGTHFMWHILNALMLGWMIEVYRRHMLRV